MRAEFHSGASRLLVCADLELIALSLAEVFDNARKAVAEAPDPKVLVQLEVVDGEAVISVHDNGCGIAENDYEEVFVDFNSAWPNGVRSTGLGLGWIRRVFEPTRATCRRSIHLFGGSLFSADPADRT